MRIITAGSTSNVLDDLFVQDATAAGGAGLATLAYNTSGLTCYYKRSNGTAAVAVTLANIATLGTFVSGGFKAVDATNMPGVYEFHPPDLAMATGAKSVTFYFQGASGMAPAIVTYTLSAFDLQTAKQAVSLAASDVTGNLPANAVQIAGQTASAAAAVTFPPSIGTSTYAGADTAGTTTLLGRIGGAVTIAGGKVAATLASGDYSGNTPQTGDAFARIGAAGAGLTALGDARLTHLNADVGSRAAAGSQMDLVDAPNATAVAAIQDGLATLANQATIIGGLGADIPVTSDAVATANSASVFSGTSALSAADGTYLNMVVVFTSGANVSLARKITAYAGSTNQITLDAALPAAPAAADTFDILGYAG
jgi:hypothetical protein